MQDNFDVHKWNKERYLNESNESKPKDEFTKAEDKLYKAVTGEEPKVATKNKMREPKVNEIVFDNPHLSKKSLEGVSDHVITDLSDGYYGLSDSLKTLSYALMKASQENKDWINEYKTFQEIKKLFDTLETGVII